MALNPSPATQKHRTQLLLENPFFDSSQTVWPLGLELYRAHCSPVRPHSQRLSRPILDSWAWPGLKHRFSDENSLWGANVYIEVTKDIPGANMASISGTFLSKVFEGPYRNIQKSNEEMKTFVQGRREEPSEAVLLLHDLSELREEVREELRCHPGSNMNMASTALHRTGIPLGFIAAGELERNVSSTRECVTHSDNRPFLKLLWNRPTLVT